MFERIKAKRESGEGGFTLIELLLVIVILGILAAVVVFSVRGITDRGTGASCNATLSSTKTGVEAYYAKQGTYPTTFHAMDGTDDINLKFMDTSLIGAGPFNATISPTGGAWVVTIGAAGAVSATHSNGATPPVQINTPTQCG
jgi:prepilin-type N-terminal cleavage/methylation domain-containing protein